MSMIDLINKTRLHEPLNTNEIQSIVQEFTQGNIPDYQMAAWLMAVCIQGLSDEETSDLTLAMAQSGKQLSWDDLPSPPVDKHSTGGVGDTTTLLILPLLAACGATAAKMSGRGLGFTGGTLDKLDSIPGFQSVLSESEFKELLRKHGIALTGQSTDLAPADGKIYALRDVTGTVESLPLIASSIMSKKLAAGASAIVLDVKVGSGGFMKNREDAEKLAQTMIHIGKSANRRITAYLSNMDQPLGNHIGNGLEVMEVIKLLQNSDLSSDLAKVSIALAGEMLFLAGQASSSDEGIKLIEEAWLSGKGLEKFRQWIHIQHGDPSIIEHPENLIKNAHSKDILAEEDGFICGFDVEGLGNLARDLGAGRLKKTDHIDPAAGLILHKRLGDKILKNDKWLTLYQNKEISSHLYEQAQNLIQISPEIPKISPLFQGKLE